MVVDVQSMNSNARTRLHNLRVLMNKPIGVVEYATRGQVLLGFALMVGGVIAFCFNQYMTNHDANLRMEITVEALRAQVNAQGGMIAEIHSKQASEHDVIIGIAGEVHEVKSWVYDGENGIKDHLNRKR